MTETISFSEAKLNIKAKVFDKMPMTLHSELGSGSAPDGQKVTVKQPVTSECVFIQHGDGQVYRIAYIDLVSAVLDAEKKATKTSTALVKSAIDDEATNTAEKLKGYVVEKYPHYASTVNVVTWAKSFQLLKKQDERFTYELQAKVMKWLFEQYQPRGSFDWREQVRSGIKFRKHFPALLDLIRKEIGDAQMETI
jgi:hypothetical protein